MLRAVGFDKVSILDGGFNEWERLGFITSNVNFSFPASNLTFLPRDDIFVNKDMVKEAINDNSTKILNSLTSDIHSGNNPRYGRRGRIPNSLNIPFHELLDSKSGKSYFNVKATNGQVIGTSQNYSSKSSMENGIASVKKNAPIAEVSDLT